ncbi:hypothetical protein B0H10DRAFT_2214066 [Mycena sp. CBHHK59/15]|nr:hypothetical protein B0H10DRAFT_2214066 [Mycena sp. CBHHK59/15]
MTQLTNGWSRFCRRWDAAHRDAAKLCLVHPPPCAPPHPTAHAGLPPLSFTDHRRPSHVRAHTAPAEEGEEGVTLSRKSRPTKIQAQLRIGMLGTEKCILCDSCPGRNADTAFWAKTAVRNTLDGDAQQERSKADGMERRLTMSDFDFRRGAS